MANEAQKTVGQNDQSEINKENSAMSGMVSTSDEEKTSGEKVITIRLERLIRETSEEEEQFDRCTAIQDVLRAVVNHSDEVKLLSIDKKDQIEKFKKLDERTWEKYIIGTSVAINTGSREAFVFNLKTATTITFRQLKYLTSTMDVLNKWEWYMNQHRLNFHNTNAQLIFNLFLIHPFWVNKVILASEIDKIIKEYVNEDASECLKRKWGSSFCNLLRDTTDTVVEIGVRNWKTDYVADTGEVLKVSTKVLTMRVDRLILRQMKDVVNCIQWDKYMVGKMIEENPKLNDTASRVNLVYKHNALWKESAYVYLSWMPERMWSICLPDNEDTTVEEVLLEAVHEIDGAKKKLFRSINKIKESTGLYYLITTKKLLHAAENFAIQLMAKVSLTNEFKEDKSLHNPEGYDILVGRKTDWDRNLHQQNNSINSTSNSEFSSNGNRERKMHTTKQPQKSTSSEMRSTSNDSTGTEINTKGTKENSVLPADVLERLQRLEEQVKEMQAQMNQILLMMNEHAVLLENKGLDVSSTLCNGILKDIKRLSLSSNPPSTHTVDMDEETVRTRNPRSRHRYR